jgi:hypothetical protein
MRQGAFRTRETRHERGRATSADLPVLWGALTIDASWTTCVWLQVRLSTKGHTSRQAEPENDRISMYSRALTPVHAPWCVRGRSASAGADDLQPVHSTTMEPTIAGVWCDRSVTNRAGMGRYGGIRGRTSRGHGVSIAARSDPPMFGNVIHCDRARVGGRDRRNAAW